MHHHQLLAGPRGRRVLFELLLATEPKPAPSDMGRLGQLLWQTRVDTKSDEIGVAERLAPEILATEIKSSPLPGTVDEQVLLQAVGRAVDAAMYWQLPDGIDRLLRREIVREALHDVAVLVADSAAAARWNDGFDHEQQVWVRLGHNWEDPAPYAAQLGADLGRLSRWREAFVTYDAGRGGDVGKGYDTRFFTGTWWSAPLQLGRHTSTKLGEYGATGLWWQEDSFGCECAELVEIDVDFGARIFTIHGESGWVRLCRDYPLDVTEDKHSSWGPATARNGRWVMPDWRRVSHDFDAVYLTVRGYLGTAGRVVKIEDRTASMIAGWAPGDTYWLRNCAHLSDRRSRWVGEYASGGELVWREESGG
ncbi:hypothetical protein [Corynebacterium halotolerans]|uniref:hypothetical protein n=1 Tax=Corynebacterium halotolerans TaxID=225326 RepID=UPI003CF9D2AE